MDSVGVDDMDDTDDTNERLKNPTWFMDKKSWSKKLDTVFEQIDNIQKKIHGGLPNSKITFVPYIVLLYNRLDNDQVLIYNRTYGISEANIYASHVCNNDITVYADVDKFITAETEYLKYHYQNLSDNDDNENEDDEEFYKRLPQICYDKNITHLPSNNQVHIDHESHTFCSEVAIHISRKIIILSKNIDSVQKIISFVKENGKSTKKKIDDSSSD